MKRPIVSYTDLPYKAVAVPADGSTVTLTDFVPGKRKTDAKLTLTIRRDRTTLYLHAHRIKANADVDCSNHRSGLDIWQKGGDVMEFFFGAVEPEPWLLQLAVGAGGGTFDTGNCAGRWKAKSKISGRSWELDLVIPLELLKLQNLCCSFDCFSVDAETHSVSAWSPSRNAHSFENYGEMLFCDYDTAHLAKFGVLPARKLDRKGFEKIVNASRIPAETIVHGPWLAHPGCDTMTIGFATAGCAPAFAEYRKAGEKNFHRIACDLQDGIVARHKTVHLAVLSGLKSGTAYEYRLITQPVSGEREEVSPVRTFRTFPETKKDFSFVLLSDIHSENRTLRKLLALPHVGKADFVVNLGDYLSSASGTKGYFTGFLDAENEVLQGTKPAVFGRGNHEQVGIFSNCYQELFRLPSGKTYGIFRCGKICFLLLDAGNDHPDDPQKIHQNAVLLKEERRWLEETAESELFRKAEKRIALIHIPPHRQDEYDSRASYHLVKDIPFDLMLCGHLHKYMVISPGSGKGDFKRNNTSRKDCAVLPYPVIANDMDTLLFVHCSSGGKIRVEAVDSDGKIIDTQTL